MPLSTLISNTDSCTVHSVYATQAKGNVTCINFLRDITALRVDVEICSV